MQKKVVNVQLYIIEQVDPFFIHRSSSRPDRVFIHVPDARVITKNWSFRRQRQGHSGQKIVMLLRYIDIRGERELICSD